MAHVTLAKKQQGVVLIVALIMVVAVTGIAVTLMNSSSIDIKITNAVQEREVAETGSPFDLLHFHLCFRRGLSTWVSALRNILELVHIPAIKPHNAYLKTGKK